MSPAGSCIGVAIASTIVAFPLTACAATAEDEPEALETLAARDIDPETSSESRSPETAFTLSAIGTLAPLAAFSLAPSGVTGAVAGAGVLAGPSLGYFYGRCPERGGAGMGLRLLIGAGALGATIAINRRSRSEFPNVWPLTIGATAIVCSALWDVGAVHAAVTKKSGTPLESEASLTVQPIVFAGDEPTAGVAVQLRW